TASPAEPWRRPMFRPVALCAAFALAGLTLLAPRALANWTALPGAVQVSVVPAHLKVATAPDGQGGMFVAWDDSVGTPDHQPVKIRLLDRHGVAQWSPGGIALENGTVRGTGVDVCADNFGGVYVSWIRFEDNPFLNFVGWRVRVTHLDASGAVTFGFP